MTQTSQKLEPCRLCHNAAVRCIHWQTVEGRSYGTVRCKECGLNIQGFLDEIVRRWNTRPAADKALREALQQMVEEKCDYMRINNLGDPEKQHTIKVARAALAPSPIASKDKSDAQ